MDPTGAGRLRGFRAASTEVGAYVFFRRTAMDMDKPPATQFGKVRIQP